MTYEIRTLIPADAEAARRLGGEAFGMPRTAPTEPATLGTEGETSFGAFDAGRLAARMVDREFDSWFGGVLVPTSGIAGVTVTAEDRGQGLLGDLFASTFTHARERGAVISTLHPSAPKIYRRFGYEVISDFTDVEVPTAVLGTIRPPAAITLRRATTDDVESVREVYDRWAARQNGPLSRRGVSFQESPADYFGDYTATTLAVADDGTVCGYANWNRGHSTGLDEVIEVKDLLADGPDGFAALLAMFGSFSSVAGRVRIASSGDDLAKVFVPTLHWQVVHSSQYMLKIIDVIGAFTVRHYPRFVKAELPFTLSGDVQEDLNAGYRLVITDGKATCTKVTDPGGPVFDPRGLALAYAGVQSIANLRNLGLVTGGTPSDDEQWDTVLGGRQVHIRNHF